MSKKLVGLIEGYRKQKNIFRRGLFSLLIKREKFKLIKLIWLLSLKLRVKKSDKIKVCFGPIIEREDTLGFRKWGIDPIVKGINKKSKKYVADIFFGDEDLSKFNIIVIVKNFDNISKEIIKNLKENKTTLIYNPRDNPAGCRESHEENRWFIKSMAGIITSNPRQEKSFKENDRHIKLIASPIISRKYKIDYKKKENLDVIWQGHSYNLKYMYRLHPIIKKINEETKNRIHLVYHTERPPEQIDTGIIRYLKWKISDWEDMLVKSDIGVVIKPIGNKHQQRKPPTKILTYMAAGLPTICTPTAADKLVMKHGETGFFAYTDEEWNKYLRLLIEDPKLRERIGKAAREYAAKHYHIEKITKEYTDFFDLLLRKK